MGGPYQLIPKFVKLKKAMMTEHQPPALVPGIVPDVPMVPDEGTGTQDLYDIDTVFQFHPQARDVRPGKGNGEKMDPADARKFALLATPKSNWRRKLSTHWPAPFQLDGETWATVENFVQAQKFKDQPPTYRDFAIGSNSKWSKDPKLAILAATDKGANLRDASVRPDSTATSADLAKAQYRGHEAKFQQHPGLADLLKATGTARLMRYKKGQKPTEAVGLMTLRNALVTDSAKAP
jgi:predicted NAD-dependent protein-ADP-ribosyltransferase YbiA (DUF1768 family)